MLIQYYEISDVKNFYLQWESSHGAFISHNRKLHLRNFLKENVNKLKQKLSNFQKVSSLNSMNFFSLAETKILNLLLGEVHYEL